MKETYIELMDAVMNAYSIEHIRTYTSSVEQNGIEEHGYPRLVANLGILIAHGKRREFKDYFKKMMDLCCIELPVAKEKNGGRAGNDFTVKEVVFCLLELEKAEVFDKNITDNWRCELEKIEPLKAYSVIAPVPVAPMGNWAAFAGVSEYVRNYAGMGSESAFIDNQIKSQFHAFDENGMYRDPNEPMVYDMVTRLQLAIPLYFGYDGECRERLEEELDKSADITLKMQSVTGEIPFGGRSNQFLHNETFYAALCEFYASVFKRKGDIKRAGMFKRAAKIATESIIPWLEEDKISHVKNYYDTDSMYGCEEYAYFDKYMVTAASWLYMAYAFADDSIEELPCPAESENFVCETGNHFHKTFLKYGKYAVEIEKSADEEYDGSGIGRIHKKGAPSAICLSTSFAKKPHYGIDIENTSCFAICAGIKTGNGFVYGYNNNVKYKTVEKKVTDEYVFVKYECTAEDGSAFYTGCKTSDKGVEISAEGKGELEILFPLFYFDGKDKTEITLTDKSADVLYKGWKCKYTTHDIIKHRDEIYANRNGHYKSAAVCGKNKITLRIEICN